MITTGFPALRTDLAEVAAYSRAAARGHVRHTASSNESDAAPAPSVVAAIARAGAAGNRYPSLLGDDLVEALAARAGAHPDQVVVGGGSLALLQQLLLAHCGTGTEVVLGWRSYEAYPILARIAGATPVLVDLDAQHRLDLDAMVAAVTPATRVVLLCNPNNPTGTALPDDQVLAAVRALPSDVLVVLDEAYREFGPSRIDAAALVAEHPNVVVARTFSKAYALAGLRAGWLLADARIADNVRRASPPFGLSAVAEAAALAALDEPGHLTDVVDRVVGSREQFSTGMRALGFEVAESAANFVWLPMGSWSEDFEAACAAVGVSVRAFAGEGVRVTVGNPEAERLVLEAAARFV